MSTLPVNTEIKIAQELLDLDNKERSNPFPWRGQFSPEFVEVLLKTYGKEGQTVLDPFAGVGTTLLEAAKRGMRGRGTELNPSAFLMAESVEWVRFSLREREKLLTKAFAILTEASSVQNSACSFEHFHEGRTVRSLASRVKNESDKEVKHILANTLMRAMSNDGSFDKAFRQHSTILRGLPITTMSHLVFHADARATPLAPRSIDLVLTSPPYINVFNYHENNRRAMELLGWDILTVAKAELGSNRKNRGNRFLTVIQYCLDMQVVLSEIKRVLKRTGRAILIVGRVSRVRGIPFENGELVSSLATSGGFNLMLKQNRRFTNRYGQQIVEEILHLEPSNGNEGNCARGIAVAMLQNKLRQNTIQAVGEDLESAIGAASKVESSPVYGLGVVQD